MKTLRRALVALSLAGFIAGVLRAKGKGGVPPQAGGWAILIILGIPLRLIAVALLGLWRGRSRVKSLPGSFDCKVRPAAPDASPRSSRYLARAQWVHDVTVVHGGSSFLAASTPYGVT